MSAQEVSTTSNYSSLHHPSDTYFLSTPSVSLSHTQHTLSHTYTHTQPGIHIRTVLSLLSLVTHTLVSGAIKVLSANSLLQKLSHVARGVSLPAETLWAPGTRTTHYFHGKGQELCHLTLKWSWVELPPPQTMTKGQFSVLPLIQWVWIWEARAAPRSACELLLVTVASRHGGSDNWLQGAP